jgi:hypothetical protein
VIRTMVAVPYWGVWFVIYSLRSHSR